MTNCDSYWIGRFCASPSYLLEKPVFSSHVIITYGHSDITPWKLVLLVLSLLSLGKSPALTVSHNKMLNVTTIRCSAWLVAAVHHAISAMVRDSDTTNCRSRMRNVPVVSAPIQTTSFDINTGHADAIILFARVWSPQMNIGKYCPSGPIAVRSFRALTDHNVIWIRGRRPDTFVTCQITFDCSIASAYRFVISWLTIAPIFAGLIVLLTEPPLVVNAFHNDAAANEPLCIVIRV